MYLRRVTHGVTWSLMVWSSIIRVFFGGVCASLKIEGHLCPSPWRLPSKSSLRFEILDSTLPFVSESHRLLMPFTNSYISFITWHITIPLYNMKFASDFIAHSEYLQIWMHIWILNAPSVSPNLNQTSPNECHFLTTILYILKTYL